MEELSIGSMACLSGWVEQACSAVLLSCFVFLPFPLLSPAKGALSFCLVFKTCGDSCLALIWPMSLADTFLFSLSSLQSEWQVLSSSVAQEFSNCCVNICFPGHRFSCSTVTSVHFSGTSPATAGQRCASLTGRKSVSYSAHVSAAVSEQGTFLDPMNGKANLRVCMRTLNPVIRLP